MLVYKLDRLGRTQLGIQDAADRLERLDVALRSATEHYEPHLEEKAFASSVENGPAQLALEHSSNCAGEISRTPPMWNALAL